MLGTGLVVVTPVTGWALVPFGFFSMTLDGGVAATAVSLGRVRRAWAVATSTASARSIAGFPITQVLTSMPYDEIIRARAVSCASFGRGLPAVVPSAARVTLVRVDGWLWSRVLAMAGFPVWRATRSTGGRSWTTRGFRTSTGSIPLACWFVVSPDFSHGSIPSATLWRPFADGPSWRPYGQTASGPFEFLVAGGSGGIDPHLSRVGVKCPPTIAQCCLWLGREASLCPQSISGCRVLQKMKQRK